MGEFRKNVNKNPKEKLSLGFWVSKTKTDTAGTGAINPPPSVIGLRPITPKILLGGSRKS